MAEVMREVTEAAELRGVAEQYPNVRKVTVDEAAGVAYVFVGRSMQAQTVTGKAFVALVKALPEKAADETDDETPVGPGKPKKK